MRGINSIGLKRAGLDEETIRSIKDVFKRLFKSDDNMAESIAEVREEFANIPEVINMIDFIERSNEGRQGRQEEEQGRDLAGG